MRLYEESGGLLESLFTKRCDLGISKRDNIEIEEYMAIHQHDKNANELWQYFMSVIT